MIENPKSLVLIDDSNLYYGFIKQQWKLDFEKFFRWINNNFHPIAVFFFGGIVSQRTFFEKNPQHTLKDFIDQQKHRKAFFKMLRNTGYLVRTKPVAGAYDSTSGKYKSKCNFDVEITIVALDKLAEYDELILCSGDADFEKLIKYIKGKYKKSVVVAHNDRISSRLRAAANKVISLESIRELIEKK